MAQTKRKRRRKHRGTQGGRIDRKPARGRPRSRAEAKSRAQARGKKRGARERTVSPPTWASAAKKGLFAAVLFFVLLMVGFGREPLPSAAIALLMVGFYVPMAYLTDRFFYDRQMRKAERERLAKAERRAGE
ncbi:MAG: hypothetical protein ACRDL6_04615 [Solirubrobacterales bacterium]